MIVGNNGAISYLCLFLVVIVTSTILGIYEIKNAAFKIAEEQNKKDAHMYSVISLYKETLDAITFCNKQLERLGYLSMMLSVIPGANSLVPYVNSVGKGLSWYQDFLLTRLKIYAPILDITLREKNSLKLIPNYHSVSYRRRMGFSFFGLFSIPPLLEIKNNVFTTACVKHRGIITDTSVCVDHKEYKNEKSLWFAPTDGNWGILIKNAY